MAQSARMNAYQRSSAEIWMQLQQEYAMMRDLHSVIGKTPAPTQNTGGSSYPSSMLTSSGGAETSTSRAPLQHDGIPPRSRSTMEPTGRRDVPATFARNRSGSIEIQQPFPSDFSTPECRQMDDGYNSYQGQPVTSQGFGVGMTAGSQQGHGGPTFGGMTDGDARAAKQTNRETPATSNQPAAQDEVLVGGGMAAPAIPGTGTPWRRPELWDEGRQRPRSRGGDRLRMTPDRFVGRGPILDYLSHFEACAGVNGWSEEEALRYLAASMRGPAVKVLVQQTGRRLTYAELVNRLKQRFGPAGKSEVFLAELRTRRRRPKESLQELGQSIRELTALAYQEFDEAGQDRLARGHFMDAIVRPEVREGLFRAQPRTLDDAIEAALSTEAFLRMETERNDSRSQRYSRALTDDGVQQKSKSTKDADDAVSKLTKAVEKLIARSESAKHSGPRPNATAPVTRAPAFLLPEYQGNNCFNCGQEGHWRRDCPFPRMHPTGSVPASMGGDRRRCHHCNRVGHIWRNCPQAQYAEQIPASNQREQEPATLRSDVGGVQQEQPEQARLVGSPDSKRQGLYIESKINGQPIKFLIDTGSSQSYVSTTIFDKIEELRKPVLQRVTHTVHQADGSPLETRGKTMAEIQMGNLLIVIEVTIANLSNEGIIGLDFLIHSQSVLDCRRLELQTPWETIPCRDYKGQPFCCMIVASETSVVPAGHEAILKGTVAGGRSKQVMGVGLLEEPSNQTETLSKGLLIARAVV